MPGPRSDSDESLAARAALGDSAALGVLLDRYRRRVFAIHLRASGTTEVAEELFQETWLRVSQRLALFDPSRSFSKWLLSIAINLSIDHSRRQKHRRRVQATPSQTLEQAPGDERRADLRLVDDQQRLEVAHALAELPEALRTAVLMRYFDELTEREMAESLDVPRGTVKSRLHNALKALRRQLEETP